MPHSKTRQTQLREWVEAGGHLIIDADSLPDSEEDEKDISHNFLTDLGVRTSYPDYEEEGEDEADEKQISIKFEGVEQPMSITMSTSQQLIDTQDKAGAGSKLGKGYGLLQYEMGSGYVTVLADNSFMFNQQIGNEDHALALADLVGINHDDKVWLVHDVTMPSLTELAWQHAPQAVIAILAAALIWLWI